MWELLMHEAYNSIWYSYKRERFFPGYSQSVSQSGFMWVPPNHRMGYLQFCLLSSVLLFLTVASAQEYLFDEYDFEPTVRARRDVTDFIMQRNNEELRENVRVRRDAAVVRHRRQGGHGHGGGGGGGGGHEGVTGPVHTFVKTDEHAHFKWGVRHHVGHEYAGHR